MKDRGFTQTLKLRIGLKPLVRRTIRSSSAGFTLIETLVAITVLTIAVAAPLTLAAQSLYTAYNTRDQVIAFNLAQDAMEAIRAQRDHNILEILVNNNTSLNWLDNLNSFVQTPGDTNPKFFTIDTLVKNGNNFNMCTSPENSGSCENLLFDKKLGFYGHNLLGVEVVESKFKRYAQIKEISDTNGDEVRVRVEVSWRSGLISNTRKVVLEENLYNWIAGITTAP